MVPQSTVPALALALVALVIQIRQTAAYSCDDWRWSRGRFPTSRFVKRWGIQLKRSPRPCYPVLTPSVPSILVRQAAGGKDHESEGEPRPGMEEAFRQLEALQSLNDDSNDVQMPPSGQATKKIQLDTAADLPPLTNTDVSLEQEIAIYKDMVGELEQNEDVAAYSEILSELGGAPKQVDDTYAQVLLDLGGTPPQLTTQKNSVEQEVFLPTTLKVTDGDDDGVDISTEQFMDRALQEALKEVTVKNPKILGTDAKSVLDNKEIMREIEGIFDQGNEKLMASLEDIRLEQVRSANLEHWPLISQQLDFGFTNRRDGLYCNFGCSSSNVYVPLCFDSKR
jgi:hypothetical protein